MFDFHRGERLHLVGSCIHDGGLDQLLNFHGANLRLRRCHDRGFDYALNLGGAGAFGRGGFNGFLHHSANFFGGWACRSGRRRGGRGRSGRGYIRNFLLNNGANLISGGACGRRSRLAACECEQRSDAYENQQRKEM